MPSKDNHYYITRLELFAWFGRPVVVSPRGYRTGEILRVWARTGACLSDRMMKGCGEISSVSEA